MKCRCKQHTLESFFSTKTSILNNSAFLYMHTSKLRRCESESSSCHSESELLWYYYHVLSQWLIAVLSSHCLDLRHPCVLYSFFFQTNLSSCTWTSLYFMYSHGFNMCRVYLDVCSFFIQLDKALRHRRLPTCGSLCWALQKQIIQEVAFWFGAWLGTWKDTGSCSPP